MTGTVIVIVLVFSLISSSYQVVSDLSESRKKREQIVAKCEYDAFKLGSDISDVFNSPIGDEDWNDRIYQEYILKHMGFAPWLSSNNAIARDIQQSNGWVGKAIEDSPYAVLNKKWIYMLGDSTTRQIWSSFAAPFQGNNFERNSKEWSRSYCSNQEHRAEHSKVGNPHYHEEGWGGPCAKNEKTCHVAGYGEGGLLTYDWKHFPYEDYDEWMWGDSGPWITGFPGESRRPDVLVVQVGLHTCFHAYPDGFYSKHLHEPNMTMVENHIQGIKTLMAAIRNAVSYSKVVYNTTTSVVVMTSGLIGIENGTLIDECILRQNRVAADAAHSFGFAVLEQGEIERRFMYKSIQSATPLMQQDMHLAQPWQNLIATCLTKLLSCLDVSSPLLSNPSIIDAYYKNSTTVNEFLLTRKKGRGFMNPLHKPPE